MKERTVFSLFYNYNSHGDRYLFLILCLASLVMTSCGGGGDKPSVSQPPSAPVLLSQPEENILLTGPADLSSAQTQSFELEIKSLEENMVPPIEITLEGIDPQNATFKMVETSETTAFIDEEKKSIIFKEMPTFPVMIRFELTPTDTPADTEEEIEIAPRLVVRDTVTEVPLMIKELPKIRKKMIERAERRLEEGATIAGVPIFEPTNFGLAVTPEGADTGPIIWSASIPGVSLKANSDKSVQVTSHVCKGFTLQALTFDPSVGPTEPKIFTIPVETNCGSAFTPVLSFKTQSESEAIGNIRMTFSIPNGQMAVKGLLGTFFEEERFTTNIPHFSEPPFTLNANDFGFSNFGKLNRLQIILFSHACPVNKDCILRIEMADEETKRIPNIELTRASDVASDGSTIDYKFDTADDSGEGIRRVDITIPNPLSVD